MSCNRRWRTSNLGEAPALGYVGPTPLADVVSNKSSGQKKGPCAGHDPFQLLGDLNHHLFANLPLGEAADGNQFLDPPRGGGR